MIPMRTRNDSLPPPAGRGADSGGCGKEWELRPGGMLVQSRTGVDQNRPPAPTIRVRVKHGSICHEIRISSVASFGELKKMLSGPTGLHHEDQKLFYKDKERDSKVFLDAVGVKDKSKILLQEDPISQEKRYIEMKKNAKLEKAAKAISEISSEVDRLGKQVSSLETVVSKGGKVVENDVVKLIELLMNQLVKLDVIFSVGGVKLQRDMQVTRVQKYIETLDLLKVKNAKPGINGAQSLSAHQQQQSGLSSEKSLIDSPVQQSLIDSPVVITTQWETFDPTPPTSTAAAASTVHAVKPSFTWDLL